MTEAAFWDGFVAVYGRERYVQVRYLERRERLDLPHCGDPDCGCPTERQLQELLKRTA